MMKAVFQKELLFGKEEKTKKAWKKLFQVEG